MVLDAAGAEFAGYAVLALVADFGALAGELFGVAGVVDQAALFQAGDYFLDEVFIGGAADEGLFHFGDGMGAAHQDFDGGVVKGGLGVDRAGVEQGGRIEVGSREVQKLTNAKKKEESTQSHRDTENGTKKEEAKKDFTTE